MLFVIPSVFVTEPIFLLSILATTTTIYILKEYVTFANKIRFIFVEILIVIFAVKTL